MKAPLKLGFDSHPFSEHQPGLVISGESHLSPLIRRNIVRWFCCDLRSYSRMVVGNRNYSRIRMRSIEKDMVKLVKSLSTFWKSLSANPTAKQLLRWQPDDHAIGKVFNKGSWTSPSPVHQTKFGAKLNYRKSDHNDSMKDIRAFVVNKRDNIRAALQKASSGTNLNRPNASTIRKLFKKMFF